MRIGATMMVKSEIIVDTLRAMNAAKHGERGEIVRAAAERAGVSKQTMARWLAQAGDTWRRTRADSGKTCITREAAEKIAATMLFCRQSNKRMMPPVEAFLTLVDAGEIAPVVDAATGVIRTPARSTILRALAVHGVAPELLTRPAPHVQMASRHPNHVWQIDASVCALFYMENGRARAADASEEYKNKPQNMARAQAGSVVRYVVVDHFSGALFVHYALGTESTANAAEALIRAMECATPGLMHGVPKMLCADQGAAHKSAPFRRLLDCLGIELWLHAPKKARATGAAEVANRIVGEQFERKLRLFEIDGIEALNAAAQDWMVQFHLSRVHSRHGHTRFGMWSTIAPADLVEIDGALAREMVLSRPQRRTVDGELHIPFAGEQYDVSEVPDVYPGCRIEVCVNPLHPDCVCVICTQPDGKTRITHAPRVQRNDAQFAADAPIWGEAFRELKETPVETARRRVADTARDLPANLRNKRAQARTDALELTAGEKLFGARATPEKLFAAPDVLPLPRKGETTATPPVAVQRAVEQYSHFRAARWLAERGVALTDTVHALIDREWPDGVPETDLEELQRRAQTASGLQIVKGGER